MAKLKEAKNAKASKSSFITPPPKVSAPTPSPKKASSPLHPAPPPCAPQGAAPSTAQPAPKTEGARLARLRRLCEMKPSGRCAVPKEVHERWKSGTKEEREAMLEEFEKANWSRDLWIQIQSGFASIFFCILRNQKIGLFLPLYLSGFLEKVQGPWY